jgi:hypothetical protein
MGIGVLSANIGLKEFFSAFVVIFNFINLPAGRQVLIGFNCRLDIIKCQHSSKPWTLSATKNNTPL